MRKECCYVMKKVYCILCIIMMCLFCGCETDDIKINNEYGVINEKENITDKEKSDIRDMALLFVRSRTYCPYNTVKEEYIEGDYYHFVIEACTGEEFRLKINYKEKDENGQYLMYSE